MRRVDWRNERTTVTAYSLPVGMVAEIRRRARAEDRPYSWVVRRALERYLAASDYKTQTRLEGENDGS